MAIEHSWLHNLPDNLSQVAPLVTSQKHLSQICDAQQATSRTIHPGSWGLGIWAIEHGIGKLIIYRGVTG